MTNQPNRIEVELLGFAEGQIRKFYGALFQVLTSATPVATGFARGSLTPAVGKPVLDELQRPSNDAQASRTAQRLLANHKSKTKSIANTYKIDQGRLFFTYRAGYTVYLNQGSSSQAPKNFVERGIAATLRAF